MEFEYTITESEYVKANKLYTKPTTTILISYTIAIIALIIISITATSFTLRASAIGGIVGGYIGQIITRHIFAPWKTKKQYHAYQAIQESVAVKILPESLFFKSNTGEENLAWSRIKKWRENDELLLIYQALEVYHIIPKRVGNGITLIKEALEAHVGKKT